MQRARKGERCQQLLHGCERAWECGPAASSIRKGEAVLCSHPSRGAPGWCGLRVGPARLPASPLALPLPRTPAARFALHWPPASVRRGSPASLLSRLLRTTGERGRPGAASRRAGGWVRPLRGPAPFSDPAHSPAPTVYCTACQTSVQFFLPWLSSSFLTSLFLDLFLQPLPTSSFCSPSLVLLLPLFCLRSKVLHLHLFE